MAGCRSFKKTEILEVLNNLSSLRDRTLFLLGVKSGFRISELLSLKVSDVSQFGRIVERVRVNASRMKGKECSREVPLHDEARTALKQLLESYPKDYEGFLFKSEQGDKAISRMQAHKVLSKAFKTLELQGKVASHSMRKTFAQNVYKALDKDIFKTAKAMGHKSVSSTANYLSVDQDEIDKAIMSI
jgi:integrase